MKKSTEVSTTVNEKAMAVFRDGYPVEQSIERMIFPRISFASQNVTEGKGKAMKVVTEAGTFFTEQQGDKEEEYTDDDGKKAKRKVWEKDEIGTTFKATILFERKQLRYYNESTETYTSSPIYDTEDQIIPLFRGKEEVDRGTPPELQGRKEYAGTTQKGKPKSNLEVNRILYVIYKGDVYQLSIRGTSMYAYLTYRRDLNKQGLLPPAVLTRFDSESKEKGKINWNQMMFEMVEALEGDALTESLENYTNLKGKIEAEKAFYASQKKEDDGTAEIAAAGEEDDEEEDF